MIDKLTVDKIYDAAQIVDVVSDFVTLKKRGVNYVGLCPFHEDSSPSFYVSPSKNICKCFACGEGGTSVQFIMKHEQASYHDALRYLAKKYGVEIKERELSDEEKRMQSDRESMMIVNGWAQKFFSSRLLEHAEGNTIGMPYFVERGFREDIVRKFQLGYSLGKRDDLYRNAMEHGFNEEYLLKTGLVYKRDDGSVVDRFYGRVLFPVHTLSGKVVAFGGRVLGKKDKVAKYVNSPDSEIYHKSNELYGIFFARQAIAKADKCYLVEGYTDVISMHQAGIENVVASSGTALTHGQIRLIHRFTKNITVLYDGDAAGIKAAIRGVDMLLEEGMNVKIVLLPEGEDPDSYARTHNSFDFALYMEQSEVDFIRFKAKLLLKDAGNDPIKRATLIRDIMESVAVIPDSIIRSVYIKECSHLLDEREQLLIDEVMKIRSRNKSSGQAQREREQRAAAAAAARSAAAATAAESAPQAIEKAPEGAKNLPSGDGKAETSVFIPPSGDGKVETGVFVSPSGDGKVETSVFVSPSADGRFSAGVSASPSPESGSQGAVGAFAHHSAHYPYRKFEAALIRYVVRTGERPLFSMEEDGVVRILKLAEYIRMQLSCDNIDMQVPIYKQILDEAVEQCADNTFVASRHFLMHADLAVSRLAVDMMSDRYQLSKHFDKKPDVPPLTEEELSEAEAKMTAEERLSREKQLAKDEARRAEEEQRELESHVVHDILVLKDAYVKHEINEINRQIKLFQSDEEKVLELMTKRMSLDKMKRALNKELGERIIIGIIK